MTIRVRRIRINAIYLCYMDEHIRFEHNSKVTTLVVVEVVWVGCAPRTFCSRNPRNRSRPVTTATKASTQINETQYKSMKRNKNQCNSNRTRPVTTATHETTKHKKEAMSTTINTINTANTATNNTIQSETTKNYKTTTTTKNYGNKNITKTTTTTTTC